MVNRKISDFPVTTTISDTDFLTLLHAGVNQIMTWANAKATIFTALFTNASDFPIDADATSAGDRSVTFTLSATTFVRLLWNNSLSIFQFVNNAGTLQKLAVANATGSTHAVTKAQLDTEVNARIGADNALVAAQVFTDENTADIAIVSGAGVTPFAHGLGAKPRQIDAFLVCQTAEFGYAVDEEIPTANFAFYFALIGTSVPQGAVIRSDATNIMVQFVVASGSASVYPGTDLTPGNEGNAVSLTDANWKLRLRYRL